MRAREWGPSAYLRSPARRRDWGPAPSSPGQDSGDFLEPAGEIEGSEARGTGGGRADRVSAAWQGPCDQVQVCPSPPPARRRQPEELSYLALLPLRAVLAGSRLGRSAFHATYCATPFEPVAVLDAEHANERQCGL